VTNWTRDKVSEICPVMKTNEQRLALMQIEIGDLASENVKRTMLLVNHSLSTFSKYIYISFDNFPYFLSQKLAFMFWLNQKNLATSNSNSLT